MPTPEFRWSEYEVRMPQTGPLAAGDAASRFTVAADEPVITIPLPDLSAWQAPFLVAEAFDLPLLTDPTPGLARGGVAGGSSPWRCWLPTRPCRCRQAW